MPICFKWCRKCWGCYLETNLDVLKMLVGVLQHYQKNSMVGKNEMQVKVGIIWNNIFFLLEKNDFLKYEIYSKETYMNLLYIGLISILIHA